MTKYVTLILFFFFTATAEAQVNCDSIPWSATRKLQPSEFRDIADTGKTMIAFTLTRFAYKVSPQEGSAVINTAVSFYPCSSWLNRANVKGSIVHEQLHFDITEYFKRLFLKRVSETRSSEDMFPVSTKAIFREVADLKRTMNADYDRQTNYGLNTQEQNKWTIKIESLLNDLDKFKDNTITINLK